MVTPVKQFPLGVWHRTHDLSITLVRIPTVLVTVSNRPQCRNWNPDKPPEFHRRKLASRDQPFDTANADGEGLRCSALVYEKNLHVVHLDEGGLYLSRE
jgi:hypothetical protein